MISPARDFYWRNWEDDIPASGKCPHHIQYAAPGLPLPCADMTCRGSPRGERLIMPAELVGQQSLCALHFTRIVDEGRIAWQLAEPKPAGAGGWEP